MLEILKRVFTPKENIGGNLCNGKLSVTDRFVRESLKPYRGYVSYESVRKIVRANKNS